MNYTDITVDISSVVDLINIKSFPEMIIRFLKDNDKKEYNNLRKFYSVFLDYFGEDIKESYLNRILKYLSSDKPSKIYLIDDINDGLYDKELTKFSSGLVKIINSTDNYEILYDSINDKVNYVFYEHEEDYYKIKDLYDKKEYTKFIYKLLKHAFQNYKTSLPGIVGENLYKNTQTVRMHLPRYIKALNAGSILGNDNCTIQLYSILCHNNPDLAVNVLLRAKENELVLWVAAYCLEKLKIKKETVDMIKNKFKYILDYHDSFIDNISLTDYGNKKFGDLFIYAYKMYNYCYRKYDFTKAGNSLGKALLYDVVDYYNDREKSIEYAKELLKREMQRGNTDSITNLAIYYYNNLEKEDYSVDRVKHLLKSPASFGEVSSCYYLGEILFDEGNYKEAYKYLEMASSQNNGDADLLLGRYYELFDNLKEAKRYYKQGILNGNFDCAYYLALLYIDCNDGIDKIKGYELLDKYYDLFSDKIKKLVETVLNKKNS